jgi:hypothetical protein
MSQYFDMEQNIRSLWIPQSLEEQRTTWFPPIVGRPHIAIPIGNKCICFEFDAPEELLQILVKIMILAKISNSPDTFRSWPQLKTYSHSLILTILPIARNILNFSKYYTMIADFITRNFDFDGSFGFRLEYAASFLDTLKNNLIIHCFVDVFREYNDFLFICEQSDISYTQFNPELIQNGRLTLQFNTPKNCINQFRRSNIIINGFVLNTSVNMNYGVELIPVINENYSKRAVRHTSDNIDRFAKSLIHIPESIMSNPEPFIIVGGPALMLL